MKKTLFAVVFSLLFFITGEIPAKIVFSDIDIFTDNRLLLRSESDNPGSLRQNALFLSALPDFSLNQLTAFPEKIELIDNGRIVQVRNAFGAVRLSVSGGLPQSIAGFPGFASGAPALGGRIEEMAASPDGKWLLYVEPLNAAQGNLILLEIATGGKIIITANVERPSSFFPAAWSPDSRIFVYHHDGRLYYQTVNASSYPVDERYRLIGEGTVNSVCWGTGGDFFYLRGSTIYRVRSQELFARAIYADLIEIGTAVGNLPFEFDHGFDLFWVAPDSRSILLCKAGRNIFYYPLSADTASPLPYLALSRSCSSFSVLWSASGIITVIGTSYGPAGNNLSAYRLDTGKADGFQALSSPFAGGTGAALSPDGTKALFWGDGGIAVYDYAEWKETSRLSSERTTQCIWIDNDRFIAGGYARIEAISVSGSRVLVCLSGAEEAGFETQQGRILAKSGGIWYASDGKNRWTVSANAEPRPASLFSSRYRVYLEQQYSGPYSNIPMIRNITSVGTVPLLQPVYYSSSETDEGRREIALVFDLYDDAAGLAEVLDTLRRFNLRATFFLCGEFIRRYPQAARDIADAGHEAASLFFAPVDLSDARYRIEGDFISRGLARNEDEFFNATGRELGLLWHPPYYVGSESIAAAASTAGYRTINRSIDPMDWITRADVRRTGLNQESASLMVNRIIAEKRNGSIIPVRLGLLSGGRDDYLFTRLPVLLDALIREGYNIVTVSELLKN
ncbi:polysaccharide deacetylase [Spirochaetia bacterium]|nr:polysaccharide deacetylase [Spirochaetia bacterium]